MSPPWEVVVVGAGPAGAVAALQAARLGCGPVLLLDRAPAGRSKTCGGGLSPGARGLLRQLGLWEDVAREAYPIRGLRLVSGSGREVLLTGGETAAVLVRSRFDRLLVEAAVRAGVTFRPEARADGLLEDGRAVHGVRCGAEDIPARWVVLATGARSRLARSVRPEACSPKPAAFPGHLLHGCLTRFQGVPFRPNVLELVFDPELAPHYGWLFPEAPDCVNIGLCVSARSLGGRSLHDLFDRFLDRHFPGRIARATPAGRFEAHPIAGSATVEHPAAEGVLLVGEANRLTNLATGEGVSYAMESGLLAARTISKARERGCSRAEATRAYHRSLRRAFAVRLAVAGLFARLGGPLLDGVTAAGASPLVRRLAGGALARV